MIRHLCFLQDARGKWRIRVVIGKEVAFTQVNLERRTVGCFSDVVSCLCFMFRHDYKWSCFLSFYYRPGRMLSSYC